VCDFLKCGLVVESVVMSSIETSGCKVNKCGVDSRSMFHTKIIEGKAAGRGLEIGDNELAVWRVTTN
jgi:hypothetical protein